LGQTFGGVTLGQSSVGLRDIGGIVREEFASNSFLAVTVAGLVLLFSGLIVFAFN
jgi:hypothetical protein